MKLKTKLKMRLKTKLIIVMSFIIVILAVVLATISCVTNYNSSIAMINDFIPKVVNSTSLAIGNKIKDYISSVEGFSKNASLIQAVTDEERLKALQSLKSTDFHSFGYIDQNRKIVSSNGEEPENLDFYDISISGKEYFSEPFKDEDEDLLLGLVSYPVYNSAGAVQGVLFCTFDFSAICDIVKSTSVSANTSPTVYNQEGTLMAYSDKQLVIDGYNLYTQWLDLLKDDTVVRQAYSRALSGQQNLEYFHADGDKIVFAYAPIAHTTWSYNFYVPVSDFMGSFYFSLWITIIAAIILLIISILFVSAYSTRLVRPIRQLRNRIITLSQGDLHTPFQVQHSNDELEDLSIALAQTIQYLNTTIVDVSENLKLIGNCNLNLKFNVEYKGDFHEIGKSFQTIADQLNDIFEAINKAAYQVTNGSEQLSSGSHALSQGVTEQASATQQLAATIGEVSSQIKNNAEHAVQASTKANSVGDAMVQSNQKMQQMIQAMTEISSSSNEIGKIIKAIEDIAFQTNILALNAAVEAARAGTAGKGFAVVADEVRNLASKSAEASKDTSILIENSLRAVDHGTKIADDTAQSMLFAVQGAKDVSSTIDKISEASKSQAGSIAQISHGIDQITSVIQTNSATSEQSAAAAQELTNQAQKLKSLVERFQLKEETLLDSENF